MSLDQAPAPNRTSRWIVVAGLGLIAIAGMAFWGLKVDLGPPPAGVAGDDLLVNGRVIYLTRCVSCHGEKGRGDGPLSKTTIGPKPRDFVADPWKYGDRAENALGVVANGVKGTAMSGWKTVYSEAELRAVTAYVYHLAGKRIPDALRAD